MFIMFSLFDYQNTWPIGCDQKGRDNQDSTVPNKQLQVPCVACKHTTLECTGLSTLCE